MYSLQSAVCGLQSAVYKIVTTPALKLIEELKLGTSR